MCDFLTWRFRHLAWCHFPTAITTLKNITAILDMQITLSCSLNCQFKFIINEMQYSLIGYRAYKLPTANYQYLTTFKQTHASCETRAFACLFCGYYILCGWHARVSSQRTTLVDKQSKYISSYKISFF